MTYDYKQFVDILDSTVHYDRVIRVVDFVRVLVNRVPDSIILELTREYLQDALSRGVMHRYQVIDSGNNLTATWVYVSSKYTLKTA